MAINPNNLSQTADLTFSDEFNGNALDQSKWGTAYPWGGTTGNTNEANGEAQWYVNAEYDGLQHLDTYTVGEGVLDIKAQRVDGGTQSMTNGHDYASGLINTKDAFSQAYGYFEMRADLPSGQGTWPAFWLLPTDGGWPPELDVMEVGIGNDKDEGLLTSAHWDAGGHKLVNKETVVPGLTDDGFHTFGMDWQEDKTTWYLDGREVYQIDTPPGLDQPMYMLANLALGGHHAPDPDGSTQHMLIDYIRAYKEKPGSADDFFML